MKPRLAVLLEAVFTVCLWSLAVYLAAATVLLFTLGAAGRLFQLSLPGLPVALDTFYLYALLPVLGLISYLAMNAWDLYNCRHCGYRREHPPRAPDVTLPVLAQAADLTAGEVLKIRQWQVMRAGYNGLLYHYNELPPRSSAASTAE